MGRENGHIYHVFVQGSYGVLTVYLSKEGVSGCSVYISFPKKLAHYFSPRKRGSEELLAGVT